jgi:hypothetical protein
MISAAFGKVLGRRIRGSGRLLPLRRRTLLLLQ